MTGERETPPDCLVIGVHDAAIHAVEIRMLANVDFLPHTRPSELRACNELTHGKGF